MTKSLLEQYAEDPVHLRLLLQESAIYEATELLESVMHEMGITRSELAKRLGKSKGWVTQLLDGEANKTIRTIADAFAVLGREYRSFQQPIQIESVARRTVSSSRLSTKSGEYEPEERHILRIFEVDKSSPIRASDVTIQEAVAQ